MAALRCALFVHNLNHPAGQQVLSDLLIALGLIMVWMWQDARRSDRAVWLWLLLTLATGSFGPPLYLLGGKKTGTI